MSYAGLLDNQLHVTRSTRTADGYGGWTTTDVMIYRRVPCRFNAMSGNDMSLYADKLGALAGFTVFMEAGRDVRENDLLTKTDDGRKFDVKLVRNYDEQGRFLTIVCAERARKTG